VLPVSSANAAMSQTEPGSVATTRRTWPVAMSRSDFLVLTMGIGQLRPEASNSLSKCMAVSWGAVVRRRSRI